MLEPRRRVAQHRDGALQRLDLAGDRAEREQPHAVLARDAELAREVDLLVADVERLARAPGRGQRGGERRAPGQEAGVADAPRALAAGALAREPERLSGAALRQPQPRQAVEQEGEAEHLRPVRGQVGDRTQCCGLVELAALDQRVDQRRDHPRQRHRPPAQVGLDLGDAALAHADQRAQRDGVGLGRGAAAIASACSSRPAAISSISVSLVAATTPSSSPSRRRDASAGGPHA